MSIQSSAEQAFHSLIETYNQAIVNEEHRLHVKKPEYRSIAWYVDHLFKTMGAGTAGIKIAEITQELEQIRTTADKSQRTKEVREMMRDRVYPAYHRLLKAEVERQETEPPLSVEEALKQTQEEGELSDLLSRLASRTVPIRAATDYAGILYMFEQLSLPKESFTDGSNGYPFGAVHVTFVPEWGKTS